MSKAQLEQWQRARQAAKRQAKLNQHNAPGSGLSLHEQRLLRARGVGGRGTKELAAWARRAAAAATVLEQHLEAHPHDSGDPAAASAPGAKLCGALDTKPAWLSSLGPVDPSSAALVREHDLQTWFYDDTGPEDATAADGDAGTVDGSRGGRGGVLGSRHGSGDAAADLVAMRAVKTGNNRCQFKVIFLSGICSRCSRKLSCSIAMQSMIRV
jgi:hypothetical protein